MSKCRFTLWASPSEVASAIGHAVSKSETSGVVFVYGFAPMESQGKLLVPGQLLEGGLFERLYIGFDQRLLPPLLEWSDATPKRDGWVSAWLGRMCVKGVDSILTNTELTVDTNAESGTRACGLVRAVRRRLMPQLNVGVRVSNSRTGASRVYRNLSYTVSAEQMRMAGTKWDRALGSSQILSYSPG